MALKKLGRFNSEHVRELADNFETHVARAGFQFAQVCAVYSRRVGKILLRNSFGVTKASEVRREYIPQIHAGTENRCWLLTHRFKATKIGNARSRRASGSEMFRPCLTVLVFCSLAGCGVIRQKQIQAEMQAITDRCKADIGATRAAGVLATKTGIFDARDITPSMVANQTLPTREEIAAARELDPVVATCRRNIVDFVQINEPIAVPDFETMRITAVEITAVFEQGTMKWGDYNRLVLEAYKLGLQALQQTEMQAQAVNAAQRQAAAAENANANAILALQGLASSLRANQPVVTNCSQTGSFTNCVSR